MNEIPRDAVRRLVLPRSDRSDHSIRPCSREGCPNARRRGRGIRYCSEECKRAVKLASKRADGTERRLRTPPADFRAARLWRKYRLTVDGFNAILHSQGNCCAVCGGSEPRHPNGWQVDHDHGCCIGSVSCGRCVRGILCGPCNQQVLPVIEGGQLCNALAYLDRWAQR